MTTDDRRVRIDAIAAKALMLSLGESFAVPVSGGREEVQSAMEEVEDAIVRQYEYGCEMAAGLAPPEEIATRYVVTRDAAHLIIERVQEPSE